VGAGKVLNHGSQYVHAAAGFPISERQEGGARLQGMQKESLPGEPLITIITSTYNAAVYLPNAIKSIREQTYENIEWIVVDGASTDGTLDILRQNEDVIDYWVSEQDTGIYDAWNKGIRHAKGDWILFLGADDHLWKQDVLQKMAAMLDAAYPTYRVVYGKVALVNKEGEGIYFPGEAWEKIRNRFRSVMCLPHTGLFHHRDLFRVHGEFDTSFRISGDYEFLLRELKNRDAMFVDFVIAGMSIGGISSNPATSETMLFEMRRATRKNGRTFPGLPWFLAAFRHMLRRILWRILGERGARHLLDMGRRLMGKPAHWTRT
jgi:glycosyltransferase involved in cell wall biosynthesis